MRDQVEGVDEAAVVQHALLHPVGTLIHIVTTEGERHATRLVQASLGGGA